MALMSIEERKEFSAKRGIFVKHKCDHCSEPIVSTLTYTGKRGEYCSRPCLERAEPDHRRLMKEKANMSIDKTEAAETTAPKKKKKKKVAAEVPAKKKKKVKADTTDAKPAKKAAEPTTKGNPFRGGSVISKAFEMCLVGTTRAKLTKFAEDNEVGVARVFGGMKLEEYPPGSGNKWKYSEDESGNIKISVGGKKKAAASEEPVKKKKVKEEVVEEEEQQQQQEQQEQE